MLSPDEYLYDDIELPDPDTPYAHHETSSDEMEMSQTEDEVSDGKTQIFNIILFILRI